MEDNVLTDASTKLDQLAEKVKLMRDDLHIVRVQCATLEVELATLFNPELMQAISRADDRRRELELSMAAWNSVDLKNTEDKQEN